MPVRLARHANGRVLTGVLVGAVLCLFVTFVYLWATNRQDIDRNETALVALCAQRHDLDLRIARTQEILDQTRGKEFVFGIPRKLLVDGQVQSMATRRSLDILDCKEEP
jgi:uncharacterized membrane protein YedE/YeeE